ncbi:MAG: LytR C-terminal domain-containing protein [Jatrophihabitans sp.]
MAHTAPPSGSHRHLERIFGVLLLLVGAAVAFVAVLALNHPKGHLVANSTRTTSSGPAPSTSASTSRSSSSSATSSPALSPTPSRTSPVSSTAGSGRLPLIVLNNTSPVSSTDAADRFRQGGWTVTDTSTFSGAILSTAVYYDPNVAGAQAAAAALQQQFPAIKRVKQKFDGLPEGPIVVVLASDYN